MWRPRSFNVIGARFFAWGKRTATMFLFSLKFRDRAGNISRLLPG